MAKKKKSQAEQDMMESYLYAMQKRRERGENPDTEDILGRDPSEKIDGSNITADDIRLHGLQYASRLVNTPLRKIKPVKKVEKKQSRKYYNNNYKEGE